MSAHLPTGVGPAPAPAHALPARGLVPASLEILGFRGYLVNDVECILPPICFVAGGVFTMGADLKPGEVYSRGTQPSFRLDVAEYSIGQYPVTVAEYACAVRAGAVRQPPVWEFGERRADWTQQLDGMDHPVVAVSWYDATAYAQWLSQLTGQPWRLPSEAEWEKMARWDPVTQRTRTYPWGDTFDAERCNTRESGIGGTSHVGSYPTGASPYGVWDVAGNVGEWTSSPWQPYPFLAGDTPPVEQSASSRITRGGAWDASALMARAATRGGAHPLAVADIIGFRLAF